MAYTHLKTASPAPHVAQLLLARPDAANALNTAMALEIKHFSDNLPGDIRVIVFSGEGRHFCAGADLKERKGMSEAAWKAQHETFRAARDAILTCPVPVIAAVHGAAMGGGLELALVCDFIYAASDARFALTEATLGIMPGMGGTQTLPRAIGSRMARELLYSGRVFSAEEAYEWGMVNRLCAPGKLMEDALSCAGAIAANAPLSVKAIKKSVTQGADAALQHDFSIEIEHYNKLLPTRDRQEGIHAWGEKRKPVFSGE